ncbi:MAG: hypothetical protein ABJF50_10955 [Paracoccaceae bacterium]
MEQKFLIFAFIVYVVGVAIAINAAKRHGRWVRGLISLALGALLILAVFSPTRTTQYATAALQVLVLFGVAVPLFSFGLGKVLGSVASFLPTGHLWRLLKAALVLAPVVMLSLYMHQRNQRFEALQAKASKQHAAFQLTDIEGTISGISISFPASPQISASHDCLNRDGRVRNCRTMFWRAVGLRYREGLSDPPVFEEILIEPTIRDIAPWCVRRPDLATRVWCSAPLDFQVRFKGKAERPLGESWRKLTTTQDGFSIFCQETVNGMNCQGQHRVAPDVFARVWLRSPDLERLTIEAPDMPKQIDSLWADMAR